MSLNPELTLFFHLSWLCAVVWRQFQGNKTWTLLTTYSWYSQGWYTFQTVGGRDGERHWQKWPWVAWTLEEHQNFSQVKPISPHGIPSHRVSGDVRSKWLHRNRKSKWNSSSTKRENLGRNLGMGIGGGAGQGEQKKKCIPSWLGAPGVITRLYAASTICRLNR